MQRINAARGTTTMTGIRTNEALLKALEKASSRPLSHERMEQQRLSFVMGSLDDDNSMTREQVERVLEQQDNGQLVLK
jgi:uncharacterized protein YgbK (DUF1537 family)